MRSQPAGREAGGRQSEQLCHLSLTWKRPRWVRRRGKAKVGWNPVGPLSSSTASRTPGPSSGKWAKHAFPAPVLVVYFPSLVHPTFPQDPQREISGQAPRLLRAERAASLYLSAAADRPERHQRSDQVRLTRDHSALLPPCRLLAKNLQARLTQGGHPPGHQAEF